MVGLILAVGIFAVLLVAFNAWGIRGRIPMLKSSNKLVAAAGWTLFILVWLTVAGLAAPPVPNNPSASESSTALRSSSTSAQRSTATPTPSVVGTPTPAPIRATPLPTDKPVVVAATAKAATQATLPPPPPPPALSYCGAPANPWHYNFCGGNVVQPPPSNFCSYFNCIASFWTEDRPNDGYVVQCVDGRFSDSGGEAGSPCSSHGGPNRILYSP